MSVDRVSRVPGEHRPKQATDGQTGSIGEVFRGLSGTPAREGCSGVNRWLYMVVEGAKIVVMIFQEFKPVNTGTTIRQDKIN
jgi:hypothetical protein